MRVAQPRNEMTENNSRRRISEPGLKAHSHEANFLAITATGPCCKVCLSKGNPDGRFAVQQVPGRALPDGVRREFFGGMFFEA